MKERIIKTYESYNLDDLDLGRFSKIIDKKRYLKQNTDGTYDYGYDLDFSYMGLKSLTEIPIKFKNVYGDFRCDQNQLKNLEGAPENIHDGMFWCNMNDLISLQYMPNVFNFKDSSSNVVDCSQNNLLSKAFTSIIKANISLRDNPFSITDEVIETVSKMTPKQRMLELTFFEKNDTKAYEMMSEVLEKIRG
jgi:hypothetical protein